MKQQTIFLFFFLLVCLPASHAQLTRVACIGNSVTYGYGLKDRAVSSYPAQLQHLLGKGYIVENFGHSGATLLKQGHNPYYKTKAFSEALAFKPDIAIVHLGLNDTDPRNWPNHKEAFEADYAWLLDTLKEVNPSVQLYVCRLTPIFSGHPRFKSGTRNWFWQIQELIPGIAAANHASLINLHEALYHRPDLFPDNLHPVEEGAAIIARTVYQSITGNYGGLQPAKVFTNNMVMQRRKPIPVYGTADAGERIKVQLAGNNASAVTDANGKWKIMLPAMEHGGPYKLTITGRHQKIIVENILIGDVWLCSGQSNMDFKLKNAEGGKEELRSVNAAHRNIRLFRLEAIAQTDNSAWDSLTLVKTNRGEFFSGNWKDCDSSAAADFSAIGYYFGRRLAKEENIPIGLIQASVGGSPIESWIDRHTMEQDPLLVEELNNWRKSDFYQDFCRERSSVNLRNATNDKQRHPYEPCYNYETAIEPLTSFPIKGVIWYQGESNAHNVELYHRLFPALVNSWRKKWGDAFPFYYVQLTSIDRPSWPSFRDLQRQMVKEIPGTGMAVTLDLGDSLNVHPTRKKEVAERLAVLALHYTYQRPVAANGPELIGTDIRRQKMILQFSHARRLSTGNGKTLTGFELVNDKGVRFAAVASIHANEVWIEIPPGERFQKILYAWQPFTRANLVNEYGLPASTFSKKLHP